MRAFDVCNGDADGLCALLQLRLAAPIKATLVTGVKRDIRLLDRVQAHAGDRVTVLDISLDANRDALMRVLDAGAVVEYFDHHYAGEIPRHANLRARIDSAPGVCTSILVDRHLQGAHRIWAAVAAFGDNLGDEARTLAVSISLTAHQCARLQRLGECLNYNAYGETEADLSIAPAALFEIMRRYADPFDLLDAEPIIERIDAARHDDLARARALRAAHQTARGSLFILDDAPWSRRVHGAFANELALRSPERAHALLVPDGHGRFIVSVRAARDRPYGADTLCRQFETGGGRAQSAGINSLAPRDLPRFIEAFERSL